MTTSIIRGIRENARAGVLRLLASIPQSRRRVFDLWLDLHAAAPTPEVLLQAFLRGRYPLTDPARGRIYWKSSDPRGIVPVDGFHVPKKLNRLFRIGHFQVSINRCFGEVMRACGDREETWITTEIVDLYCEMYRLGLAHSFETWQNGELVGGRVGLGIGRYFVGISQFNRVRDAGKVAFLYSAATLAEHQYLLHDVQEWTPHLEQFGCHRLAGNEFQRRLSVAAMSPSLFDWQSRRAIAETVELTCPPRPGVDDARVADCAAASRTGVDAILCGMG